MFLQRFWERFYFAKNAPKATFKNAINEALGNIYLAKMLLTDEYSDDVRNKVYEIQRDLESIAKRD